MNQREQIEKRQAVAHVLGLQKLLSWRATVFCEKHKCKTVEDIREKVQRDYRYLKERNFGIGTYNELRKLVGLKTTVHDEPTMKERIELLENRLREVQESLFEAQLIRNRLLGTMQEIVRRTVIDARPLTPIEQKQLFEKSQEFVIKSKFEKWTDLEENL